MGLFARLKKTESSTEAFVRQLSEGRSYVDEARTLFSSVAAKAREAYTAIEPGADDLLVKDASRLLLTGSKINRVPIQISMRAESRNPKFREETSDMAVDHLEAAVALIGRSAHDDKVRASVAALAEAMEHIGIPMT